MNEQIKQLALQCGAWHQVYDNKRFMLNNNFDVEKFAELIVQECLGVLDKRFMGDLNREDREVRRCIADVKKHFGVE